MAAVGRGLAAAWPAVESKASCYTPLTSRDEERQGCIHGEELPYVLGAPLVGGLAHFPRNYTKAEVLLAEATMIYWSNFARTGNPNEPQEPEPSLGARGAERNRFRNIEWTAYESVHKKYLNLDTKPKVKSHYRAHRLSFWLNLVPDLHRPGGDDVPPAHHQLSEDDGAGGARPPLPPALPPQQPLPPALAGGAGAGAGAGGAAGGAGAGASRRPQEPTTSPASLPARHEAANYSIGTSQSLLPPLSGEDPGVSAAGASAAPPPTPPEDGFAAYSTALSVTIAIGCSLLILNVLIFAGVYYQRDKTRLHHGEGGAGGGGAGGGGGGGDGRGAGLRAKKRSENGQMPNSICGDLLAADAGANGKGAGGEALHHHPHRHHHPHQLPPPEFADLPPPPGAGAPAPPPPGATGQAVPRPPPPPKTPKPAVASLSQGGGAGGGAGAGGGGVPESQPLLPPHPMPLLNTGTLTKKGGVGGAGGGGGAGAGGGPKMEELRV